MTTDTTDTSTLYDWVEKLTKPYFDRKVIVDDDPVHGTDRKVIASLKRDGLLKQLRKAVVGGIGGHEGALPGRERIPFDTGAMELYDAVERDITRRFVVLLEQPVHLELERTLTEWYRAFEDAHSKGKVTENQYLTARAVMHGWCIKIEQHFTKPKQLELTINKYARADDGKGEIIQNPDKSWVVERRLPAECPMCGEAYAHLPASGDQVFALILEYRELGPDTIKSASGLCRFCEAVWEAGPGVRDLAYQLEQQEARRNTPA